jgi:hypothetical protein
MFSSGYMTRIKNKKFALNMEKFSNNHTLKQSRNQRPEVTDSYCTTWILKDWVSMAQVGPLRDCQAIVVVQTAFLVSLSSFQLGVFHHCFMKSFVADRDLVPALYHSVWEKLSSDLQPGCLWPQVEGSAASMADPDPGSGAFWTPGSVIRDG